MCDHAMHAQHQVATRIDRKAHGCDNDNKSRSALSLSTVVEFVSRFEWLKDH